jgi:hypothetical protein
MLAHLARHPSCVVRGAITTLLAAMLTLGPNVRAARAQNTNEANREARERFQRGVELYKEADFRAALLEFRRAYGLAPNYVVLFNLGQANYELQDYAAAKLAFEAYLREGGTAVPADRRRQVEAELTRLATRVATLTLRTNVAGAEVLVDDVLVARTPLHAPLVVSAGRRKLTVMLASAPPTTRYVDVAGGVHEVVDLPITKSEPDRESAARGPRPVVKATSTETSHAPLWIGLVTTGVLAAGASAAGLLALNTQQRLEDKLERAPTDETHVSGLRDEVRRWSLVTDVTAGAAVVAGGVTLYLALRSPGPSPSQGRAPLPLHLALGPRGVTLRGQFLARFRNAIWGAVQRAEAGSKRRRPRAFFWCSCTALAVTSAS